MPQHNEDTAQIATQIQHKHTSSFSFYNESQLHHPTSKKTNSKEVTMTNSSLLHGCEQQQHCVSTHPPTTRRTDMDRPSLASLLMPRSSRKLRFRPHGATFDLIPPRNNSHQEHSRFLSDALTTAIAIADESGSIFQKNDREPDEEKFS